MSGIGSWTVGTAGLAVALVASVLTSRARAFPPMSALQRQHLLILGTAACVVQAAHFAEELITDFPRLFPAALGLSPWSRVSFAVFNLGWLLIWMASLRAATRGRRVAEWPLWFLALALALNGVAHPVLALRARGYFPGLWTSTMAGIIGLILLRHLFRLTRRAPGDPA